MRDVYIAGPKMAEQAFSITSSQLHNIESSNIYKEREKQELIRKLNSRLDMIALVIQQHQEHK